jgi:hypothetical protein
MLVKQVLVKAASKNEGVPVMYIRNVSERLLRVIRSRAALEGHKSYGPWVIEAIKQRLEREGIEVPEDDQPEEDEP